MSKNPVNINCDLGEGLDNEELIMPLIDSCNIACGGHAGDLPTMKRVVALAGKHHVAIGAHPSYPDKENFGRVSLNMEKDALIKTIRKQMRTFEEALSEEQGDLHHIKAHGALYNDLAKNKELAGTYLEALRDYRDKVILYVPYDSEIGQIAAEKGFRTAVEAFGDRNYTDELRLVKRSEPNALITAKEEVLEHIRKILSGRVITVSGKEKALNADTICVHSDTENAVAILKYLREHLNQ